MSAQHRQYVLLLDAGRNGSTTPEAIRVKFFDWLETADAHVVQDGGANRLVISTSPEVAEQLTHLDYILHVEPYA
ncbi:hypothetical protein AB0H00_11590 [Nocardia sp. NPDC023852]|uniref:hypothetical protein n=1 Tax=Nocardia sp. NPDC023852 TaxID=3154697 RepID=UPI0033F37694